jgi:hypothetical protein
MMKRPGNQEVSKLLHVVLALTMTTTITITVMLMIPATACAQALYFISLAQISEDKQAGYDAFIKAVTPVWNRYNMQVVLRSQVIDVITGNGITGDGMMGDGQAEIPSEIAVLHVASRDEFNAYLKDPDYQAIKNLRAESVEVLAVLEGNAEEAHSSEFLKKASIFAVLLGTSYKPGSGTALDIAINGAGLIKGSPDHPFLAITSVQMFALSHDDNPLSFLADDSADTNILIAQRLQP